jgi:ATP-dependent DNA helicase RecG
MLNVICGTTLCDGLTVTEAELREMLAQRYPHEHDGCEHKEFKNLKHSISGKAGEDVISYVSAIANMDGGYLIIGVKDKTLEIVGIQDFHDCTKNNICHRILSGCQYLSSEGLRCDEFTTTDTSRTIWVLTIPRHKPRLPVNAHKRAWQRVGESLVDLRPERLAAILHENVNGVDWTSVCIAGATIADLDPDAVDQARAKFKARNAREPWCADFDAWSNDKFLDRAKLTINGQITRACLLLLGKPSSAHHLSPHPAQITWYLSDNKKEYLHVGPPLFLTTTQVLVRINARNSPQKLFPRNQLLPVEVMKFETESILEALHNCIAHQDYERNARIVVTEYPDKLVFENAGSFFLGSAEDYFKGGRTPDRYRNPWLANAMHEIRMIDTMGIGISRITSLQRERYLPLPDYGHSDDAHVALEVLGRPIDERYSQMLLERSDLDIDSVIALDRVQKGLEISDNAASRLRRESLIEGRKPNYRVAASVAKVTGTEAIYVRDKGMGKDQIKQFVLSHLKTFGGVTRDKLDELIVPMLPKSLTEKQKSDRVKNLLSEMRNEGMVAPDRPTRGAIWNLTQQLSN